MTGSAVCELSMQAAGKAKRSNLAVALVATPVMVALVLVLLRLHFEPPLVPSYELAGAPSEIILKPGDRVEMNLLPSAPVQGAIGEAAFLLWASAGRPW